MVLWSRWVKVSHPFANPAWPHSPLKPTPAQVSPARPASVKGESHSGRCTTHRESRWGCCYSPLSYAFASQMQVLVMVYMLDFDVCIWAQKVRAVRRIHAPPQPLVVESQAKGGVHGRLGRRPVAARAFRRTGLADTNAFVLAPARAGATLPPAAGLLCCSVKPGREPGDSKHPTMI